MDKRVTITHRTHIFVALYITCVVYNYDNVYLIACLEPQLIPCSQCDAMTTLVECDQHEVCNAFP
jgi:hypothetical protein